MLSTHLGEWLKPTSITVPFALLMCMKLAWKLKQSLYWVILFYKVATFVDLNNSLSEDDETDSCKLQSQFNSSVLSVNLLILKLENN